MNDANFRAEGMVYYSTQFPREDSATWWDMHRSINNNRACKICGDVGHTYKEHQGQCPYCDASHPFEQCPTSQVTCFLCEGNNHIPALCQLYPTVQQMNRQISDGMEQALEKMHEHTRSTTKAEDSVKPQESPPNITTKCCYSCGEEGHLSRNFLKKRERFPEAEVEYEEQELRDLLALERPKGKKGHKRKSTSHEHNSTPCQKQRTSSQLPHQHDGISLSKHNGHNHRNGNGENIINGKKDVCQKDLSQVLCSKCQNLGHYATTCSEKEGKGNMNIENGSNKKPKRELSQVTCYNGRNKGHYSNNCPEKKLRDAK
uniref:Uncharacterized protein n=4 Tax=Avena sativa TaxID=4498 RepID=A0ACD5W2Z0_AVESA